jgi:hypothetical protein
MSLAGAVQRIRSVQHRNPSRGYLEAAARGFLIGVLGLMLIGIATGFLGMLMVGWGCFALPFLVLVGGGIASLGGVAYQWYRTDANLCDE